MVVNPDAPQPLATALATVLSMAGIEECYGICGREIVPMWCALFESQGTAHGIRTRHAKHENGGGFAAIGSAMVSGRPVALFSTTGPGVTNTLTALEAARAAGISFVYLSPQTPPAESGRLGIQDTGPAGYFNAGLYAAGRLFDSVTVVQTAEQLPILAGHLAAGFAGPEPFAAHIVLPTSLQVEPVRWRPRLPAHRRPAPSPSPALADEVVARLASEPFVVWVGWGARHHEGQIRELLERTGAPSMSTPRGLGIADPHAGFLGVSGNGGSDTLVEDLAERAPRFALVLGTGLGEASSGWDARLVPPGGLIHVDLDPAVFGRAFPRVPTLGVQSGIGELLDAVLERRDRLVRRALVPPPARTAETPLAARGTVHPVQLMQAIQRVVVDGHTMPVLADASASFFWAAHHLRFNEPRRWAIEGRFGSMGFAGAAVVGAASAAGGPALALCGDGSLHMQDELATAVRYGIHAIWVVMNDSGLGIVRHGMQARGRLLHDTDYPDTDFAVVARAKGAAAERVTDAAQLDAALRNAIAADGPYLIDVVIDRAAVPPILARTNR